MKKIFKIFTIITSLCFSVVYFSCKKLDQQNLNGVDESLIFKDSTSLKEGITGLYSTLADKTYYGDYYPMFADLNSDNGTSGGYSNSALDEFAGYSVGASNLFLENMYVALYKSIRTSNAILNAVDNISGDKAPVGITKASIKGTALAVRALVHFDLLRAFGHHWDTNSEFGIPIILKVQGINDIAKRSTVGETYSAILKDLNEAQDSFANLSDRDPSYINLRTVQALKARVYLYMKDYANAITMVDSVIQDPAYMVLPSTTFTNIYGSRRSSESIFELAFSTQSRSYYFVDTYGRPDAAQPELFFIANQNLKDFLVNRTNDLRINLLDTTANYGGSARTLKYFGTGANDEPAYILRISEMYLIKAEALGLSANGLTNLNKIRTNRGLNALKLSNFASEEEYQQAVADERRAELNFEGHRYFDLARTGKIEDVLGITQDQGTWPIPQREISATNGLVVQNPGYSN